MNRTQLHRLGIAIILAGALSTLIPCVHAQNASQPFEKPPGSHSLSNSTASLELVKSLDLSDQQAKKLEPLMQQEKDKLAALRRDTKLTRQERVTKLKEIRAATDSKVKSLLTAEQAAKWRKAQLNDSAQPAPPQNVTRSATPRFRPPAQAATVPATEPKKN